jgi:hypothetical protein
MNLFGNIERETVVPKYEVLTPSRSLNTERKSSDSSLKGLTTTKTYRGESHDTSSFGSANNMEETFEPRGPSSFAAGSLYMSGESKSSVPSLNSQSSKSQASHASSLDTEMIQELERESMQGSYQRSNYHKKRTQRNEHQPNVPRGFKFVNNVV